jgi:hypothetical protein
MHLVWLSTGPPEGLDVQSGCLDLAVRRHAFVLSPIEEVLALVADKGPFCESAASVCTRCCGIVRRRRTQDGFDVYASVL